MTTLNVKVTNSMKKDLKRMAKRQKSVVELEPIIENLARKEALPKQYKDHALSGEWSGYRECHIQPDWLLIYCYVLYYLRKSNRYCPALYKRTLLFLPSDNLK